MHKRLYTLICFPALLFLASCGDGTPTPVSAKSDPRIIRIGVIAPLSGEDSVQGKHGLNGIKTSMIMQSSLLNGDKIEWIIKDDANDPDLSVEVFKKLIGAKVVAVVMLSNSDAVLAVNQIVDKYETPVLALLASHAKIAKSTNYMNQLSFDDDTQGLVAALYARDELLVERAAVIHEVVNSHHRSLAETFKKKFRSIGGVITHYSTMDSLKGNLVESLKKMRDDGAELLYLPVDEEFFITVCKALDTIHWAPVKLGCDGLYSSVADKYPDDFSLLEGVLVLDLYASQANLSPFGERLKKTYIDNFETRGSAYTVAGGEGCAILINALTRCVDPLGKGELSQRIRETVDFEGFMGKITIDENGKTERPLIVNIIQNGKLKFLVKVY